MSQNVDDTFEFDMVVRRSAVLDDALWRMQNITFDARRKLNVRIARGGCRIFARVKVFN